MQKKNHSLLGVLLLGLHGGNPSLESIVLGLGGGVLGLEGGDVFIVLLHMGLDGRHEEAKGLHLVGVLLELAGHSGLLAGCGAALNDQADGLGDEEVVAGALEVDVLLEVEGHVVLLRLVEGHVVLGLALLFQELVVGPLGLEDVDGELGQKDVEIALAVLELGDELVAEGRVEGRGLLLLLGLLGVGHGGLVGGGGIDGGDLAIVGDVDLLGLLGSGVGVGLDELDLLLDRGETSGRLRLLLLLLLGGKGLGGLLPGGTLLLGSLVLALALLGLLHPEGLLPLLRLAAAQLRLDDVGDCVVAQKGVAERHVTYGAAGVRAVRADLELEVLLLVPVVLDDGLEGGAAVPLEEGDALATAVSGLDKLGDDGAAQVDEGGGMGSSGDFLGAASTEGVGSFSSTSASTLRSSSALGAASTSTLAGVALDLPVAEALALEAGVVAFLFLTAADLAALASSCWASSATLGAASAVLLLSLGLRRGGVGVGTTSSTASSEGFSGVLGVAGMVEICVCVYILRTILFEGKRMQMK